MFAPATNLAHRMIAAADRIRHESMGCAVTTCNVNTFLANTSTHLHLQVMIETHFITLPRLSEAEFQALSRWNAPLEDVRGRSVSIDQMRKRRP
jgi:hypothetical protein